MKQLEEHLRSLIRAEVRSALQEAREEIRQRSATPTDFELITQPEAAAFASVSVGTIRGLIRTGRLRRYGTARAVRISKAELIKCLEAGVEPVSNPEDRIKSILRKVK